MLIAPSPQSGRWLTRIVVAAFLTLLVSVSASLVSLPASAQTPGIKMAAPAGTQWEVLAGYNTVTHEGVDPYALDLWRIDDETGGTPLLAPFSGEVGYTSDDCLSILNAEVDLLICHVFPDPSLDRRDFVAEGQQIGIVAPDGEAANNGIAHLHLQLNARDDAPGSTGDSMPFAGAYAIEGVELPAITDSNGYAGHRFTSTNAATQGTPGSSGGPSVTAPGDRTIGPGEVVTLTAQSSGVANVFWVQQSGPPVQTNVSAGTTVTFVAPSESTSLSFQVIGNANGTLVTDEVHLTVELPPAEPAEESQAASILGGQVFLGGISAVVFSGGTTEDLIDAIACPLPTLAMWASAPNGNLVQYTVDRPAFVNASWAGLFPDGIPGPVALLLRCE